MSENHGSITDWVGNPDNNDPISNRKHFSGQDVENRVLDWNTSPPTISKDAEIYAKNMASSNILALNPDLPPLPYRPISRVTVRVDICPFATDADNLTELRKMITTRPLA
jgi:hypothetical protein